MAFIKRAVGIRVIVMFVNGAGYGRRMPPGPSLPASRTAEGAAGLAAILAEPARAVVGLDFDGTLAPIVDRPAAARPADGAIEALGRLAAVVGSVAVVTGRPAPDLVALAGLAGRRELGRLTVLGHYGLDRWSPDGGYRRSPLPAGVATVRRELPALLAAAGAPEGTTIEDKDASLAVHVRGTADPDAALRRLLPPLTELAERTALALEPGRMVLELRPPGTDKGAALAALVTEREAHAVLYAGDDLGDLAAFEAVVGLRSRGVAGVTVCASSEEVQTVAQRADIVVDGPAGVVRLLDALVATIGSGG
jgi:trehalose 6-phosphate phosphatase